MSDLLGLLSALLVFVLPLVLAGWLLGRDERTSRRRKPRADREKMLR